MDCVFCKIVNGDIDCARFWEDDEFLAILDVNPNTEGMTLVIPKKHYESYVFDIPEDTYRKLMIASRRVGKILEKGLIVKRVAMVMEGLGVNHAHIKLYPLHGLLDRFKEMWAKDKVFFEKYVGYLSTQLGPQADISELKKLAEKIRSV